MTSTDAALPKDTGPNVGQSGIGVPVAELSDFPESGLLGVSAGGVELVLIKLSGQVKAFDGICPHQGTLLSEGELVVEISSKSGAATAPKLVCRSHQWCFDSASGQRVDAQGSCLRAYPVVVDKEQIYVDVTVDVNAQQSDRQSGSSTELVKDAPSLNKEMSPAALPGPKPLPVIGNLLQIDRNAFHQTLEGWAAQYGELFVYRVGGRAAFATSNAELANRALKARPDDFRRPEQLVNVSIRGMDALGIFAAEGDQWRRQRPVIVQSLDTKHLRQFFPTLLKVTERLRLRWLATAGEEASGVDVQADLMRYTVDVTATLAFAQDTNTLQSEGDVIQKHLDKIFPLIQKRLLSPFAYWRYLRLPSDRDVEKSVAFVHKAIKEFIRQGRRHLEENPEKREQPENLLQSLLVSADEEGHEVGGKKGFSEDEIADNVLTMLLAGEDTTANTLAWTLYYLAKYPAIQENMRAELRSVLGVGGIESYGQLHQLPYLDGVINETMRLKPVAPINALQALRDVELGEWLIKKGDSLTILTRVMAMNNAEFPDAEAFNPQRWITPPGEERQFNPRSFMPFGSGPRLCPGRSLALAEIKVVLAMVVQNFHVEAALDLDSVTEKMQFTMAPSGLRIHFRERGQESGC